MKFYCFVVTFLAITAGCSTEQPKVSPIAQEEKLGTVSRFLIDPRGEVNGFMMTDGTQVKFPVSMATHLTSQVPVNGRIKMKGFQENQRLFEAETITNLDTLQTVKVIDPVPPDPVYDHRGLSLLSSHGTIETQLIGRRGEINGVILKNGSIVLFGPHLPHELGVNTSIGDRIEASGYGTETSYGQSIETTSMSNF